MSEAPTQEPTVPARMTPGKENSIVNAATAQDLLKSVWPTYTKQVDARLLGQRYTLDDLLRMATSDPDFRNLLQKIGLMEV